MMSNKEIIEKLQVLKCLIEWHYSLDYVIAIDEAIRRINEKGRSEEMD